MKKPLNNILQAHDDFHFILCCGCNQKRNHLLKKFMTYRQLILGLLKKLKNIVDTEEKLKQNELDKPLST